MTGSSRIDEVLAKQKEAVEETWGGKEEPDRILMGLEVSCNWDKAYEFRQPVDLDKYPEYCKVVAFTTDLSVIIQRLRNDFYR